MRKPLLTFASVLLLAACGASVPSQVQNDNGEAKTQTVKIGVVAPLSGDAAAYGTDLEKILSYALTDVNKAAAKNGYQFELVYEDGKCAGSESVTGFQKLIDIDGVDFVLGGLCSAETLAIAPLAQSNEVVLISGWSSNPDIENEGDYVFTLSYSDALVGQELANELSQYGKVAMITEQNDYNVGLQKVILENLGGDVDLVADESFAKGSADFRNILEKIANQEPDVLFLNPNAGITAENLLKQLAEIPALANVKLVGQYVYLPEAARQEAGDVSEGMVIVDAPGLTSEAFQAAYDQIELEKGTIEALGTYYTASALDALDILTAAIEKEGANSEAVKNALRSNTYTGYLGTIYFGDNNFVQNIPVSKYTIEGGVAVPQS